MHHPSSPFTCPQLPSLAFGLTLPPFRSHCISFNSHGVIVCVRNHGIRFHVSTMYMDLSKVATFARVTHDKGREYSLMSVPYCIRSNAYSSSSVVYYTPTATLCASERERDRSTSTLLPVLTAPWVCAAIVTAGQMPTQIGVERSNQVSASIGIKQWPHRGVNMKPAAAAATSIACLRIPILLLKQTGLSFTTRRPFNLPYPLILTPSSIIACPSQNQRPIASRCTHLSLALTTQLSCRLVNASF